MKRLLLVIVMIFIFLPGCFGGYYYGGVKVYSNVPYHSSTITVMNGTMFVLDVIHDGRLVWTGVSPGEHRAVGVWNLSSSGLQTTIVIRAYDNDRLVGTAYRAFYVSGYYRQSEVWNVLRWDIQH